VNDEQKLMRICDKFNIGNFTQKVNARFSQLKVRFMLQSKAFLRGIRICRIVRIKLLVLIREIREIRIPKTFSLLGSGWHGLVGPMSISLTIVRCGIS